MRLARPGREMHVLRLMSEGAEADAVAYMKKHGMIANFEGAPQSAPVGGYEVPVVPAPSEHLVYPQTLPVPIFKLAREKLPEGVVYARIHRELGNERQKKAIIEDTGQEVLLWMGLRDQEFAKKKGKLIGQVFAIEKDGPDDSNGYRLHRG